MKTLSILISLLCLSLVAHAGKVALTIDDAPLGDGFLYKGAQRSQKIIETLQKHKVQSAFFINTGHFTEPHATERVMNYSNAGHWIANHTHSHLRLNSVGPKEFIANIEQADSLLQKFPNFTKWFRFPYLSEGANQSDRDQVRKYLSDQGYKNAYVTVDNYDYFINDLLHEATESGQKVNLPRACDMLKEIMLDGLRYYDRIAKENIGSVTHVLLMHENDLEAHCLDDLITHLQKNNWEIVSPAEAFADPLLKKEPDTLYLNQGRVAAFAQIKTGIKYRSRWEDSQALTDEFKRRQIVEATGSRP